MTKPSEIFETPEASGFSRVRDNIEEKVAHIVKLVDDKTAGYEMKIENALTTTREEAFKEALAMLPEEKNSMDDKSLPFENSPEIYGNQRINAYKNGYNTAVELMRERISKLIK
jgi:hypothetical protein